MTTALTLLGILAATVLWLAKQVLGSLLGQQARGSVPDYATKKVKAAVKRLPAELAEEYEADWLAELATLKDKPISALRYARGLPSAARKITTKGSVEARYQPWHRSSKSLAKALIEHERRLGHLVSAVAFMCAMTAAVSLSAFLQIPVGLPDLEPWSILRWFAYIAAIAVAIDVPVVMLFLFPFFVAIERVKTNQGRQGEI